MKVSDSHFLKKYRNRSIETLLRIHPEWSKEEIKDSVDKLLESKLQNPEVRLENNYTHEERDSTLLSVFDWAMETKPIIAGNGTFYKQHRHAMNPDAIMLIGFLTTRKRIKSEMFAIEDESSRLYRMKDLSQNNKKKLANSFYGGSAMKAAAFYNKFSGPAITKSAQSVISTAMTTFEAFLTSTTTFVDINECYFWLDIVLNEDWKLDDWVERKSLDEVYERIHPMVIGITEEDKQSLYKYMRHLSEEDLTRIYWKNNLIEFTDTHPIVKDLYDLIFSNINNYEYMKDVDDFSAVPKKYLDKVKNSNKPMDTWANIVDEEYFYDPNKAPKSIQEYLDGLKDIYMKYIYVRYLYTDRIYKLKNFKRQVVTVIDTDSNILSLDTFMRYLLDNLLHGTYGRSHWNNVFIAVNTITYTITSVITDTLNYYGLCSNVEDPEHRARYSMKNEFFFSNLIIAKVKKRYLSKILLREGHRLKNPKYGVTGFDFKKASTSEEASDFFMHLVKDMILEPENVDTTALLKELYDFREQVRQSLLDGERKYLPMGNAKELEAYDHPEREQSVRGALAWNVIYPDHSVELPVKLSILKTNIYKLEDIKELETKEPTIYQNIKEGIFEDKTGIFKKRNAKSGKEEEKGLAVIGIPLNEKIPEWLIPYIDFNTVINSVLAPFKSVTETFNLPSIEEGVTGRKTTGFSNIIRI